MRRLRSTYIRARDRVPPKVRERVPYSVRRAVGTRALGPDLREWDPRHRDLAPDRLTTSEITDLVYARLDDNDRAAVLDDLAPDVRRLVEDADPAEARRLVISFGLAQGRPGFAEKTGWGTAEPPEDVHAMARGPLAVAGAFYYADIVADALRAVGASPQSGFPALDFGCSSGRVARALRAAYPEVGWHGCDPNAEAIAWAAANVPGIEFAVSPQDPPLPYDAGYFEYVFAISIWSHFGPRAALDWIWEMHRVIRPDGHLVLTTHGFQSLLYYAGQGQGQRPLAQLSAIGEALYERGHWYAPEFGSGGDWGVAHPDWGSAFFTLEWLTENTRRGWSIEEFARGRAGDNQDVIVLRRKPGLRTIDPRTRPLEPDRLQTHEATERLFGRLSDDDVQAVVESFDDEHRGAYSNGDLPDVVRKHFVLSYGLHAGLDAVAAKTGLRAAVPPEDVHAMARGPLTTGGDFWYADLVADALRSGGLDLDAPARVLDFGCSSGRVVRALAAAYPDVAWHGCDPNGDAIAWAREHLPGIAFDVSPQSPPLPFFDDASLDAVFAISIWSHFAEGAALRWFGEMHRIVRPGGLLVPTTHGLQSLRYYGWNRQRTLEQLSTIGGSLFDRGFWYAPEFGDKGDWGVKDPEWGTAYLSPEWLLSNLTGSWDVVSFARGRVADNQDLYVLRRV